MPNEDISLLLFIDASVSRGLKARVSKVKQRDKCTHFGRDKNEYKRERKG